MFDQLFLFFIAVKKNIKNNSSNNSYLKTKKIKMQINSYKIKQNFNV